MSATGLEVLDKTMQTTNIWLDEIMAGIGPDRRVVWHSLRAVLHALRDRLPLDQAAHLGAQLPIVIRGLYYDQWHPAGKPEKWRTQDEFVARLNEALSDTRPTRATRRAPCSARSLATSRPARSTRSNDRCPRISAGSGPRTARWRPDLRAAPATGNDDSPMGESAAGQARSAMPARWPAQCAQQSNFRRDQDG